MTISSVRSLIDAELDGKVRTYTWRKVPTQSTSAGLWYDLSVAPGNPKAKLWFDATPLTAQQIRQSTDGGIFHGANVSPENKYLRFTRSYCATATPLPMTMILCDYLLYYPSIDDAETMPQVMDNTITLPRYTDGEGVQVIAVTLAGRTGGQSFNFSYTNQDGVAGRTSATVFQNNSTAIGQLSTGSTSSNTTNTAFIGLQAGDSGVRSIESVTMLGADVGFFALVLVKPLAITKIRTTNAPVEKDHFLDGGGISQIYDDAFLNFLVLPSGTVLSTPFIGDLKVTWG